MRKNILAAAASFGIASGALATQASAADLLPPQPTPAPIFHDWSGFYVGGNVGFGEADFESGFIEEDVLDTDSRFVLRRGFDADGIAGGVHGGFNWQVGTFVFGVEGDIMATDWDNDSDLFDDDDVHRTRNRADIDFLASVRGRVGLAFDTLLIYGTGGVAFVEGDMRVTNVATGTRSKQDFDDTGWVAGGGAEWAVVPNRFSIGGEGLFYSFDDDDDFFDEEANGIRTRGQGGFDDAWVVRARATFHFGGPGGGLFGGSGLF